MHPHGAHAPDELVPLTVGQRSRLVVTLIVPFVAFVAMVVLFQIFWVPISGPPQPLFYLLAAVVLAVTGYEALRALQDLQSGTAVATEDTIQRTWVGRRPSALRVHARLGRLGHVRMTHQARRGVLPGQRHRIVLSPASKVVWSAESLRGLEDLGR